MSVYSPEQTVLDPPGGDFPPLNMFAQGAYDYLAPIAEQDEQNGYVLATLMGAFGSAFDQVEAVCRVTDPNRAPYQQVFDINECPDDRVPGLLGWLGQFVGVAWVPYSDSDAKRLQVAAEAQFYRGAPSNTLAAAASAQTEPNRTTMIERYTGDAWQIAFAYDPAYTPDETAYEAAVSAAIPWAIIPTFTSTSLPQFEEASSAKTFESVGSTITFETATLSELQ